MTKKTPQAKSAVNHSEAYALMLNTIEAIYDSTQDQRVDPNLQTLRIAWLGLAHRPARTFRETMLAEANRDVDAAVNAFRVEAENIFRRVQYLRQLEDALRDEESDDNCESDESDKPLEPIRLGSPAEDYGV